MPNIRYQDRTIRTHEGETVLDALLRHGVKAKHSCRAGVCQSCLMRAVDGVADTKSQNGLKETLKAQNYFLACSLVPTTDMEILSPGSEVSKTYSATVTKLQRLSSSVMRVVLEVEADYNYHAGQFVELFRDMNTSRPYSIASLPTEKIVELHVRRVNNGLVSTWVHERLRLQDQVRISEARGSCFYLQKIATQPILMIATGTGLSPIVGIARDALLKGHLGDILVYHGNRAFADHYEYPPLRHLMEQYPNFRYVPCLSGESAVGFKHGRANELALAEHGSLKSWRVYLAGNPDMVQQTKRDAYLAGASLSDILADPFLFSSAN